MKQITNVAVIGGTGKAGTYLVQELINQGFHLKLLHRSGTQVVPHSSVTPVIGDARHYSAVRSLVEGCQVIVSTLGQPSGEAPIFSEATSHVLRAMQEAQIDRYVVVTGLNVDAPPTGRTRLPNKQATG